MTSCQTSPFWMVRRLATFSKTTYARSNLAHDSGHLSPQNGLGVVEPVAVPRVARALAGESTDDAVDRG
jgi:hypothetical protein